MAACAFCKDINSRNSLFCSKQCKDAQWYQNNGAHKKAYRVKNKEYIQMREKQYNLQNKEAKSQYDRKYYLNHCEKIKANKCEYRKKNHDKINAYNSEYYQNINNKLRKNLRGRLSCAIKRGFDGSRNGSFVRDLGCSIIDFKAHIKNQWTFDMSWSNYGWGDDKWHLDHITPLAKFDLTDVEQFKKAAHYTNYQPLWQPDNFKKGSK